MDLTLLTDHELDFLSTTPEEDYRPGATIFGLLIRCERLEMASLNRYKKNLTNPLTLDY